MSASAVRTCTFQGGCDGRERLCWPRGGTQVPAAIGDRRRAGGRGLAVHVPLFHAVPARRRQALLVLQLHALPRADAGVRHGHRRDPVQRDRGQHRPGVRLPDHARHRAPHRQRAGLHHRQPRYRSGGDRPPGGGLRRAGRLLLRELGHALPGLEDAHQGPDRRDRVGPRARTAGVRRHRGRHRLHWRGAEPLRAGELPPVPGPVLQDVAPPHRVPDARLRRLRGVLPVLQAGVPGDQRPGGGPHGGRHRRDHVPARRRAPQPGPGGRRGRGGRPVHRGMLAVAGAGGAGRPRRGREDAGWPPSSRRRSPGSTCPPATVSITTTAAGPTT